MSTVKLVVPANPEYLRLARLACADAGSRAGLDYEEIDDLRIAVTELCHVLLGDGASGELHLDLSTDHDGSVTVTGRSDQPGSSLDNEFSEVILAKVVDTHVVRDVGGSRTFELTKRHRT